MNAVLWKELKDSRFITLGILVVFFLGGVFEVQHREMHWILMRVLLLPVAVGVLGARLMGAESEEERIHLLTLPLPSPGFFGLRLFVSTAQAVTLVAGWFWIEQLTHPGRALNLDGLALVSVIYAFIFGFSAWLSLHTGSLASSCSLAFGGSVLLYFFAGFFGRPYHRHGMESLLLVYGGATLALVPLLIWVCRQDGFDEGPRRRVFWLGMATLLLLAGAAIFVPRL